MGNEKIEEESDSRISQLKSRRFDWIRGKNLVEEMRREDEEMLWPEFWQANIVTKVQLSWLC